MDDREKREGRLMEEFAELQRRLETLEAERKAELLAVKEEFSEGIRHRRRVEAALRQSEEQYRRIFESAADSFFVADLEGRIVEANPAACRTYGYSHEEITRLTNRDHTESVSHTIWREDRPFR